MTTDEQLIAIATACGWAKIINLLLPVYGAWGNAFPARHENALIGVAPFYVSKYPRNAKFYGNIVTRVKIPDYLNDLNAMHEAEKVMSDKNLYRKFIYLVVLDDPQNTTNEPAWATASQRAEAFLRTIGKWVSE